MSNNEGDAPDEQLDQGEGLQAGAEHAADGSVVPVDDTPEAIDEPDESDESDAESDGVPGGSRADRRHLVRQKAKRVTTKQRVRRVVLWAVVVLVVLGLVGAAALWIYRNVVPEVTEPAPQPGSVSDGAISFDDKDLSSMLGEQGADGEDGASDGAESGDEGKSGDKKDDEKSKGDEKSKDGEDGESRRVSVDVYVDYHSPESALFQESNAPQLAGWVQDGAISLTYHPVALMTAQSNGTKYSERAMGAVACVASGDPAHVVAYNQLLLTEQPEPDSPGYTSEELAEKAKSIGVESADIATCIESDKYAEWARGRTNELTEGGLPGQGGEELTGVPLVIVSGVPYAGALDDPAEFSQFVLTVESDEYYQSPTPEPSE